MTKRNRTLYPTDRPNVLATKKLNDASPNPLSILASISQTRRNMLTGLGKSYDGQRDIYQALGYAKTLEYKEYFNKFKRQDIASRIVTAFPDATWRGVPDIWEGDSKEDTPFETAWEELVEQKNVYHYFTRLDILTGIGQYAVLYMGFNDIQEIEEAKEEVAKSNSLELVYLQPYSEVNASINSLVTDTTDPRYGMPETYKLNTAVASETDDTTTTREIVVHASRVIHSAEGLLESNTLGTPRLEKIYNRLENLELITGGSAESMWRSGFPGMSFELDSEAEMTPAGEEALDEQIDDYIHSLRRYLKLQGMTANTIESNVSSPKDHFDILMQLISGATGIPSRILTGSERGELASSQDKENWIDRVAERRSDFAEPVILRPFIDTMIKYGILKTPAKGYTVVWDDVRALSDKDQAEIAKLRTEAIKAYVESGAEAIVPPLAFLTTILGMEEEEAQAILDDIIEMSNEERQDVIEAKKVEDANIDLDKGEDA